MLCDSCISYANMLFYIEINFNIKGSIKEIFKKYFKKIFHRAIEKIFPPRHWNTGLVSSGASLTSWGEGVSFVLVGNPSSDNVTIKISYGVDVLHRPALHLIFPIGLVKTESGFIVRFVETGSGRWTLVVAVIWCLSFFGFPRPDLSLWGYRNRCFLVALCCLIERRPNLEVVTNDQKASPSAGKNIGVVLVPCPRMEVCPTAISSGVDIAEVPGCHLLWQKSSQWGSQKLPQGLVSHELTAYYSIFNQFKLKACVCYFSLSLKGKYISSLFWTKYIEKKFNLQLFFLPLFHEDLFSPGLPCTTRLL